MRGANPPAPACLDPLEDALLSTRAADGRLAHRLPAGRGRKGATGNGAHRIFSAPPAVGAETAPTPVPRDDRRVATRRTGAPGPLSPAEPSVDLSAGPAGDLVTGAAPLPAEAARSGRSPLAVFRDVCSLAKPRLSSLVLFTTAGGIWLAPGQIGLARGTLTLALTMLSVAAANTLNCYLERHTDAVMRRTRQRPLPSGRLHPDVALRLGIALGVFSVPALALVTNVLTAALSAVAILSYVVVYTPLKRRTPQAVLIGAVPGAIPPLLGWTAVTNSIDAGGLALFAVLFVWQLPHFLAIALYLQEDYRRAGMRVYPVVLGEQRTRREIALYSVVLVPVTLLLTPLGLAGWLYFWCALGLGIALVVWTLNGLGGATNNQWARKLMLVTIGYLGLLFVALALDSTAMWGGS